MPGFYEARKKKTSGDKQHSGGASSTPRKSQGIQALSGQVLNMESTETRGEINANLFSNDLTSRKSVLNPLRDSRGNNGDV